MRAIITRSRGLVALVALIASLMLAGCTAVGFSVPRLTPANVLTLDCSEVTSTIEQLDTAKNGSTEDKEKFASQAGINLSKDKDLSKKRAELVAHQKVVCATGFSDITVDEATIKALTVTTGTYKCKVDGNGLVSYADYNKGQWFAADSYGPKLSKSPDRDEIQRRICRNPVEGLAFAHWFANLEFKNWKAADTNPWVAEFKDVDIREKAAYYMPLVDVQSKPDDDLVRVAVTRNHEWQDVASKLNTLLERPKVEGVLSLLSSKNYHAGYWELGLPSVGLNTDYQENKPALVFSLKNKMGKCLVRFGFNVKDGRLEQFSCAKTPGKVTPPGTPPGNPPGKHKPVCKDGKCKPMRCKHGVCPKTGSNPGLTTHGERNTVNNNDGATDSRGRQDNPQADAEAAKKAAEAEAAAKKKAAEEAAAKAAADSGGGNGDHKPADPPGEGW